MIEVVRLEGVEVRHEDDIGVPVVDLLEVHGDGIVGRKLVCHVYRADRVRPPLAEKALAGGHDGAVVILEEEKGACALVIRDILDALVHHGVHILTVGPAERRPVILRENLREEVYPVVERLDAVVLPLIGRHRNRAEARSRELFAERGVRRAVEYHIGRELHELLGVDVRAVHVAGLGVQNFGIQLREKAILRGRHARRRDADQLFRRVEEHAQNRRQRQDVAHGDALCVFGDLHDVVVVVGDGDEVRLRLGRFFLCRSFGPGLLGLFRGISLLCLCGLCGCVRLRGSRGRAAAQKQQRKQQADKGFELFHDDIPFL